MSETGWPYVQHRGGPAGFVRVLDDSTIGFADFRGNRQYISVGNLMTEERGLVITVEGFDWNCPQHITERFTREEMSAVTVPLQARIAELESELARRSASPPAG